VTSLDLLSNAYLLIIELRFDTMLYSNLGTTKILMRAISNIHAGRRFSSPGLYHWLLHLGCV